MSNYSVKLTKCGKCQFSLAHLPGGGGGVWQTCARTCARTCGGPAAGATRVGAVSTGLHGGKAQGPAAGPWGHPAGRGDGLAGTEGGQRACSPTRWPGC